MPKSNSGPTRKQTKRGIEELIASDSEVLAVGMRSLLYRIRLHYGWPGQSGYFIARIINIKVINGVIELLDHNGNPIRVVNLTSIKRAAGCRLMAQPVYDTTKPARPVPPTVPQAIALEVTEDESIEAEPHVIPPLDAPEPIRPYRPAPTSDEILDMIVLHLWLTPDAEIHDASNVEAKLAAEMTLSYAQIQSELEEAIDTGLTDDRLDCWPHGKLTFKRLMVREIPTTRRVDELRRLYPYVANGRSWPPTPPTELARSEY